MVGQDNGMSEFDLVVRGGTIIDGSGGEPFVGDVAISDGKIEASAMRLRKCGRTGRQCG